MRKIAALAELYGVRTGSHGATDLSPVCLAAALHFDLQRATTSASRNTCRTRTTPSACSRTPTRSPTASCIPATRPASASSIDEDARRHLPVSARLSAGRAAAGRDDARLVDGHADAASAAAVVIALAIAATTARRCAPRPATTSGSATPPFPSDRACRISSGATAIVAPIALADRRGDRRGAGARTLGTAGIATSPRVDRPSRPARSSPARRRHRRSSPRSAGTQTLRAAGRRRLRHSRRDDRRRSRDRHRLDRRSRASLYGTFHLLRLIQTREPLARVDIAERPRLARRLLNHWDNLDGSIERGYAGRSFCWPDAVASAHRGLRPRQRVDRHQRRRHQQRQRQSAVADRAARRQGGGDRATCLRPYRIRVYLAANFAAPRVIGGLTTNDPLDPAVARWWRAKADEIYARIPDFGGFVVKANSEGQPGPQDYGRTHADGANVLADAVAPHGGIVMWRAFVYNAEVDPDRVKRAYAEFVPLDGKFRANVFAQVKNGPLDFQPREPFHPMFGAMPKTPLMAELQITQEYLGQSNHLVYLAPMWKEFLDADTYAKGPGSPCRAGRRRLARGQARYRHGRRRQYRPRHNWTGHDFGAGELVRVRPARVESGPDAAADRRRMDPHDVGRRARGRRDDPIDHARLARRLRALHDAARPAPPDRRRSLRADAGEHRSAPRGLVGDLLSPRRRRGRRLRSHAARQRRRRSIPRPAPRLVERSGVPRRTSCCCGFTGCRGTTG